MTQVSTAEKSGPQTIETGALAPAPKPIEHLSIICSKGRPDMAYPGLILANAARMSGIKATLFFTFQGLDILNKKKIDYLHLTTVGNPSMPIPIVVGGLRSEMMKKEMEKLDLPPVSEMIEMLHDAGAKIFACRLAMDMFKLERKDLVDEVDDVISAMDFFDKSAGAQVLFI